MNKSDMISFGSSVKLFCGSMNIEVKIVENFDFEPGTMFLLQAKSIDLREEGVEPGIPKVTKESGKVTLMYVNPSEECLFSITLPEGKKELGVLKIIQKTLENSNLKVEVDMVTLDKLPDLLENTRVIIMEYGISSNEVWEKLESIDGYSSRCFKGKKVGVTKIGGAIDENNYIIIICSC